MRGQHRHRNRLTETNRLDITAGVKASNTPLFRGLQKHRHPQYRPSFRHQQAFACLFHFIFERRSLTALNATKRVSSQHNLTKEVTRSYNQQDPFFRTPCQRSSVQNPHFLPPKGKAADKTNCLRSIGPFTSEWSTTLPQTGNTDCP